MKRTLMAAIPILAGAMLALGPVQNDPRGITTSTLRGYLDKMGLKYVPHPKNPEALVVPRTDNKYADRLDLYVEIAKDQTVVLTAYARSKGRYFNLSRATDREKLLQRLLEANHRAFATFFVDDQSDIGVRFTFTTENGVGFESFRVAVTELLRIADEYTPILNEYMQKEQQ
ncbi:MAG TPA: YbjN domain-containing protein [Blastocatellia bacterium]|nr:YbjN domain-containing protein [Blastocatellia bacterium]